MNLHNFKESFNELIEHASIYYNVDEAYIEKVEEWSWLDRDDTNE
mgnify:CR=1 FL=1